MKCDAVRELLSSHLENELPPEQARCVESHLAGCVDCAEELEQLRLVVALCEELDEIDVPVGF